MQEILYEGYLWKESQWIKSWRKRWCVLTDDALYCFKKSLEYENATEIFHFNGNISENPFTGHALIHNDPKQILFHLISNDGKSERKFKISDPDSMRFYAKIKDVVQRSSARNDISNRIISERERSNRCSFPYKVLPQTLICGFIHFDLQILNSVPESIIEVISQYTNPSRSTMVLLFRPNGLRFTSTVSTSATASGSAVSAHFVDMDICSVSCKYPQFYKKWKFNEQELTRRKSKYLQTTYHREVQWGELPLFMTSHPLFRQIFGGSPHSAQCSSGSSDIGTFSVIATSLFSVIIYDGYQLTVAMDDTECNHSKSSLKGIEFQLPNVLNEYGDLEYFKVHFSPQYGLMAQKDNEIYRLSAGDEWDCNNHHFGEYQIYKIYHHLSWSKMVHFPKEISITSLCFVDEHRLFCCGQSLVMMDLKKLKQFKTVKCQLMDSRLLDEFILFPSGLWYDDDNGKVFCIGGSHSRRAQMYDMDRKRWTPLRRTRYGHDGSSSPPLVWMDRECPHLLYVCSFEKRAHNKAPKVKVEMLDTRDVRNRWVKCNDLYGAQNIDSTVWNLFFLS